MTTNTRDWKGFDSFARNPVLIGIGIGVLAAFVQVLLISAGGPESYGFCVACHTRDLVNGAVNAGIGTKLAMAPISQNAILPVMTVIGVLAGAFLSSRFFREFRGKTGSPVSYVGYLLGGILFMVFALFMGGCPYRTGLRVAYGDGIALIGLIAIIVGIFMGTKIAVSIAEREA